MHSSDLPLPARNPLDTAEFSHQEILDRLEQGRLTVLPTDDGSRLEVTHVSAPSGDRRSHRGTAPGLERRRFQPIPIPTLFPEKGPILLLVVGGFAHDLSLHQMAPFWRDDDGASYLLWLALAKAGLIHQKDREFALGRGGFWDELLPRTLGLAMTYAGYNRKGDPLLLDRVLHPWNLNRLQTLTQACWDRSMGRLKIVTIGEAARFMMCATVYGMPGMPVLSIPEPAPELFNQAAGTEAAAQHWIDWAADLFAVGRS